MHSFSKPKTLIFRLILFLFPFFSLGQPVPAAKFSFNNGAITDEISGLNAKLVNAVHSKDRFGNENNAVFVYGSSYSYLNLGCSKILKPESGSISLWVSIEDKIWSGKGPYYNPIIITKYTELNDFYEAYAIYYALPSGRIDGVNAFDSTCQVNVGSRDVISLNKWHHVVITYSYDFFSLYIDGMLNSRVQKKFETRFLETDSVIVGNTANEKNQRFLFGSVDDIEFYDRVLSDVEVQQLYKAPNPNKNANTFKILLLVAGALILIALIYFYTRHRVKTAVKKEKEKSEQANKALENELRIHRALMNPHFIFNSLNGLQDFILKNANEEANDYLIKFSQLLRKIMESNMADSISLELEIELLKRYIEIEGMRFEENIITTIHVDPLLAPSVTIIPIMMLQPFVENAIWHGLLTKEGDKTINISFEILNSEYVVCRIEDNGVGRKKEKDSNKQKSLAIQFIKQRLDLLNKIHSLACNLEIEDKPGGSGTIVIITLPILHG